MLERLWLCDLLFPPRAQVHNLEFLPIDNILFLSSAGLLLFSYSNYNPGLVLVQLTGGLHVELDVPDVLDGCFSPSLQFLAFHPLLSAS